MNDELSVIGDLAQLGSARTLDGAQALVLDDDSCAWLITAGTVELYIQSTEAEIVLHGGRRFVLGAATGQILYPMAAAARAAGLRLLALGQKARLVPLRIDALHGFLAEPARSETARLLIEQWCEALASALDLSPPAQRFQALIPGAPCTLRKDELAYPQSGLCWATLVSGTARLVGQEHLRLAQGQTVAMTSRLWLEAVEPDTVLRVRDTQQVVGDGDLHASLTLFQAFVLDCLGRQWHGEAVNESDRLREKTELEQQRLQRSLAALASVSARRAKESAYAGIDDADPLLAACQLIGRHMGTQFVAPAQARPGRQTRDPIAAISQASRVRHRHVALRADWWRHDNGPLLAFSEADGRPLALIPRRGGYDCYDTTQRSHRELTAEAAGQLKPMAYAFMAPLPQGTLTPARIWQFARRGLQREALLLVLCGVAAGLLGMLAPILAGRLFDDVIPLAERQRLLDFGLLLMLFAGVAAALEVTRGLALLRIEALLELRIEAAMMDRLLRLPSAFFKRFQTGDLALRVLGISAIRRLLTASVLGAVMTGIFASVNLVLLFYYDMRLALLGLAIAALAAGVMLLRGRAMLGHTRAMTMQEGRVSGLLFQFMTGIAKLRVAGAEKRAFAVWAEQFAVQKRLSYESGAVQNHFETFNAAYPVFASMLFFAAVYVITERLLDPGAAAAATMAGIEPLSTGDFVAVITAFSQFLTALLAMGLALISAVQAVPLYERAKPIFEALPEVHGSSGDPGTLTGDIELSHVSFRYSDSGPLILDDLSLRVEPGQMVAIVGPSGSGKSTNQQRGGALRRAEPGQSRCRGRSAADRRGAAARPRATRRRVPQHRRPVLQPDRCRRVGSGARSGPRRRHQCHADGYAHQRQRRRRHVLGRSAPAPADRQGHRSQAAHSAVRRGHQCARQPDTESRQRQPRPIARDARGHRASAEHDSARRQDLCAGSGPCR
jgi:ABC-type siderophore export system fused ATPase/permease subunit